MGDTPKVVGQREVGPCPGWRRPPWISESNSSAITGWNCTPWPNCGISRKTGYNRLARLEEGGRAGLGDRSRAPHHCPHRTARDVAAVICAAVAWPLLSNAPVQWRDAKR